MGELWIVDFTYVDGSIVRLHSALPTRNAVIDWVRATPSAWQRPGLPLRSVMIRRGIDGATL